MDLTIVIPLFNRKTYIKSTLDSIEKSGVDVKQVIIIDNNSSDGSFEYAQTIRELYHFDVLVDRETKAGAAAARNRGLALCNTEWVYFFDSDDIFTGLPSAWNTDKDLVCIPTKQRINKSLRQRAYSPVSTPHTQILNGMLNTLSMIFRTEYVRSIGGWNEECRIWDDWELGIRALVQTQKVQWIEGKAFHEILIHPESITGSSFSHKVESLITTIDIAFDDIMLMPESKEKDRSLFALFLRCYILSGECLKEKSQEASESIHAFINKVYQVGKNDYKIGHLLEWYVSKGYRGAWKIALYIVNRL